MSSVTSTWSPNSYQLQFSFKFRKLPTTALFLRNRIGRSDRCRIRVSCVANDGVEKNDIQSERSQSGCLGSSEGLSDWFGSYGESDDSQQKKGFTGIVGAGVAGVLLFAGLTFAALSVGKHSASRQKQEMEPLSQQQEALLTNEEGSRVEENYKDAQDIVQDEGNLQNDDHLRSKFENSSLESTNNIDENGLDSAHVGLSDEQYDNKLIAFDASSVQEDLPDDSGFSSPIAPDASSNSSKSISEAVGSPSPPLDYVRSENMADVGTADENLDTDKLDTELSISDNKMLDANDLQEALGSNGEKTDLCMLESSPSSDSQVQAPVRSAQSYEPQESQMAKYEELPVTSQNKDDVKTSVAFVDKGKDSFFVPGNIEESLPFDKTPVSVHPSIDTINISGQVDIMDDRPAPVLRTPGNIFSPAGIPAPSLLSAASQTLPGKILVSPVVDQAQEQALAALQVLKVIEADAQPSELCTRREYARWLVSASSVVSRNPISKVYPAMYIENITDLAFDDILPDDPDFPSIQGLAEAGLIVSKLSQRDMLSSPDEDIGSFDFFPDSPLSRQDLVTWKMALDKRLLPMADRKILHQLSGFIDIDRLDSDALPALVADLSAGDHGITALAFGYTRLFQPDKPVTKAQAAIALATGDTADVVNEELARIEAETMAEKAVAAHSALVAEVEKDINAGFEKELMVEREKIDAVERMAEEVKKEVERLRAERERENVALVKERAAIESEMEVFSKLRHQVEEQLESILSKKVEVSYEKERVEKLRKATEEENQAIVQLQYELEVERKALSMARAWAEDEAKRAREQAKVLEEARDRWERSGIKVVVDNDLREQASEGSTWLNVKKQFSVEETVSRADSLVDKLKGMAAEVTGKSKTTINMIIEKIHSLLSVLKVWTYATGKRAMELKEAAASKAGRSLQALQETTIGFTIVVKESAKRVAGDCKDGVEKLNQKFKT